jgi:hypothetical protein
MSDPRSDDMLMALLAAEAEARADAAAAPALPTLKERVDMFARSLVADGAVTAQMRAFAREQILNAMADDLADATADVAPRGDRRLHSVPLTDARLAAMAKPIARIPAPIAQQTSGGVFDGLAQLFAPLTIRRLSFAAVPLVALLAAGSVWNQGWLAGGESPQQMQPSAPTDKAATDRTAPTRGIGVARVDTANEQTLQRAIADEEAAHGRSSSALVSKLVDLAALYRTEGRLRDAQALCERALIIADRAFGAKNPETVRTINELAAIYRAEGRGKEADALLTRPNQP